jgi:hypothetical protein
MDDLIEALQIFRKYENPRWPTNCSHDQLSIMEVKPSKVSEEDTARLAELGFIVDEDEGYFYSFRFGSA